MIDPGHLVIACLLFVIAVLGAYRLVSVVRAIAATTAASPGGVLESADGTTVSTHGVVFVEEPATAAGRVFDDETEQIGAYVWRAGFRSGGEYTYDSSRSEIRQQRETFASGVETGEFGLSTDGQAARIDVSWLRDRYDAPRLATVEVGNPKSNTSLPALVTQYLIDTPFVHLEETIGECSVDSLTDIVDLYRDDVHTDEFYIDARGVAEDQELFVHGKMRVRDGQRTIVGTDETPLLLSDQGRDGLLRALSWQCLNYVVLTVGTLGFGAWVLVG